MLKFAAVLLVVVVACNAFVTNNIGSYIDRPELLSHQTVQDLTSYVAGNLFTRPESNLKNIKIVRVQTQVVRGTNYKIDFIGEPANGNGQKTTCQVVVNVNFDSTKTILQSQCQTS